MTAFQDCVAEAREAIIEAAEYEADFLNGMSRSRVSDWLSEAIHEAVDGAVPVYNYEIMQVASDPAVWSQGTSDFGQPENLMQAAQWAIYAAIEEAIGDDETIIEALMEIADRETAEA